MARMCSYCGKAECAPGRRFCSMECMDMWDAGYRIRVCTNCNKEFRKAPNKNSKVCPACIYKMHYAATIRQHAPKVEPEDRIADVIGEQQRILKETGKLISYGELVARSKK